MIVSVIVIGNFMVVVMIIMIVIIFSVMVIMMIIIGIIIVIIKIVVSYIHCHCLATVILGAVMDFPNVHKSTENVKLRTILF